MMKTAMIVLSDTGQPKGKPSVPLNDTRAIFQIYKTAGFDCKILYREDLENLSDLNDFDSLFVFYGDLINFGGKQSKNALKAIELINNFKHSVVIFDNDVLNPVNNKIRDGFERIERPVIYASPDGVGGAEKGAIDLNVSDEIEINQSFVIGKNLSKLQDVSMLPQVDVVYGGRDRPAMRKRLREISKNHTMMVYSHIAKSMKDTHAKIFKSKANFNNAQLRVINSFGRYSLMLYEKKKNYFTSRVFEQLFSNSIVLFDKQFKELSYFWNDDNTFSSLEELQELINQKWTIDRVQKQHEMAKSFDYDAQIKKEASELKRLLS